MHPIVEEDMRGWLPTGRFDLILNPRRSWFEFWKPREILVEIYRKGTEYRCYAPNIGYGYSYIPLED